MSVIFLDAGNSIIKGKILKREAGEIAFPPEIMCDIDNPIRETLAAKHDCQGSFKEKREEEIPSIKPDGALPNNY